MDDSVSSMVNDDEVIKLLHQLKQLWRKAGMHPRKWLSNSKNVLREIYIKDRAKQIDLSIDHLSSVKILGVVWSVLHQVSFSLVQLPWQKTKMKFLSKI